MNGLRKGFLVTTIWGISVLAIAGNGNGAGGGGGGGGSSGVGELYGDLYIILRDIDGVPVLDSYGCVQPISASTGEPFQLNTNEAEDIYCELTDEMAAEVQTVEFGRLNMGRAPSHMREQAFDEAVKAMNSASSIALDPAGRLILTIDGDLKTIDSPRENMALYIKLMTDGHWITEDTSPLMHGNATSDDHGSTDDDGPSTEARPVLTDNAIAMLSDLGFPHLGDVTVTNQDLDTGDMLLAASLLAAIADKSGTIGLDTVIYINSIYGINAAGSLLGETPDKTYFDFTGFRYEREVFQTRHDHTCEDGAAWTLVQQDSTGILWRADCQDILDRVFGGATVAKDNVRGFVQAADDALKVVGFIHDYSVPPLSD